jgi:hypothetical protein
MAEPQQESETVLLQMKETLNDHKNINLPEIFKEKECIETRIGDFDIDCVLDEETQVNIMTERTWEILGNSTMIPSLGGIGLFRGNLITLCGRLAQISMSAHGTSKEEDFEVVKLIQVDIGGHPPIKNGSKWLSGNFGNLIFLAVFSGRELPGPF